MNELNGDRFVLKRKLLKIFGSGFVIEDTSGRVVLEAKQKAFRLREDIRLRDASGQEVLGIFARSILDFSAAYDVVDLQTGAKLGALRRKGLHSLIRDTWQVMDAQDQAIGQIVEDSLALGLVRRFASNLVPQSFDMMVGGQKMADLRQNFNPFTYHLSVEFTPAAARFDHRLGLAAATLLAVIEGRQQRED